MAYTTIDDPTIHFKTLLYTGNGSSGHSITGVGFQPDWVWIKNREQSYSHFLTDVVRGVTKELYTDSTGSEYTRSNGLTAFGADGFTVGDNNGHNQNGNSLVSWNWKAGNSSGSSNGDGSISSTVTANTTAGFSIVKYTGTGSNATVGHGLGAVPQVTIIKGMTNSYNWGVYHHKLGNQKNLNLNTSGAANNDSGGVYYNSTTPTSTVFSIGTNVGYNASSADYIAYCFSEKQGYSKFGSYEGNGNADGAYVHLGFRPGFIMIKKSSGTEDWSMYDSKRNVNGTTNTLPLLANFNDAESGLTGKNMDILSNGVKMKTSNGELNLSGATYIYMAFAESPFVNSNGVPNNAR